MFIVAVEYRVFPLKSAILSCFTPALDTAWGQERFVSLIVDLYEPSDAEPLYDLRVRVADYVACRIIQLDPALRDLLDGMPDFAGDVAAALRDQEQEVSGGGVAGGMGI